MVVKYDAAKAGEKIRAAMDARMISNAELAQMAGCSVPYVSMIKNGRQRASAEMLQKICRPLGLNPLTLVGLHDK